MISLTAIVFIIIIFQLLYFILYFLFPLLLLQSLLTQFGGYIDLII